ncbi:cryptochrome/photolyase family protein [Chitinimonas lacunae]|uniref:Cryptochrome/photolyase family protein n=1 Tax=Chitinimonas lacunae TaxID=1963018 RepID=A0ABV8MQX5_9NEIS
MATYPLSLCWLRRDLRLTDQAALHAALAASDRVLPVFIFDRAILDGLPRDDRRVDFLHRTLAALKAELNARGRDLLIRHAQASEAIPALAAEFGAQAVFVSRDYEPAAVARDQTVAARLEAAGIAFHGCKDQVIFERDEVLTASRQPFSVFTPYKNAWLKRLAPSHLLPYPSEQQLDRLLARPAEPMPTLAELGFEPTDLDALGIVAGPAGAAARLDDFLRRIDDYAEARDFPAVKGVSYLSVHLRFGTLSIRQAVTLAQQHAGPGAAAWLNELIWREFYQQILHHRPDVVGQAFKAEYRALAFPNNEEWFRAWCEGRTGYPIVDAAMRQLNHSGYMHNRLRMVTASFLVKDLLIDWRWGERYFAEKLIDYDLAANNGGWQWAASTGCDAQPYFRIFNPLTQSRRFDPEGKFIRRYVPELAGLATDDLHAPWLAKPVDRAAAGVRLGQDYPFPLVDHARQREAALALFKKG